MSGARIDIQWSPIHGSKFLTWGTDISMYEVSSQREVPKPSSFKISDGACASLLSTISNLHYVKCVAIYPHPGPETLLAVGQANGKVVLTSFGPIEFDAKGFSGKELAPKHARQCNAVAWSPSDRGTLVAGLDKHRGDHSVMLWDVAKSPQKPIVEFGLSESVHSLAWLQQQPRTLVLGLSNKHIKLVDLRDGAKPVSSTATKAVYGIAVDPYKEQHLASFIENQVAIWDTRNFEKPIVTLAQNKPLSKLSWCPTRHNLLGALAKDSAAICLYDVQHAMVGDEEETAAIERNVQPGAQEVPLVSFSWHPSHENRLLSVAQSGRIMDYSVSERVTLNFSPALKLVRTVGRRTLRMVDERCEILSKVEDISLLMKKRALSDYGLKADLKDNAELAGEETLDQLWLWLGEHYSNAEEAAGDIRHPGVRSVLKLDSGLSNGTCARSDLICMPWSDLNSANARIYKSEQRNEALQLCGWPTGSKEELSQFVTQLETEGSHTRAAAIAVFHLRIRIAIEILNRGAAKGAGGSLQIVAMALSGFSDDRGSIWRELCQPTRTHLGDPYLRAMFAFLTTDKDNYDGVLSESGMAVADRVAFACSFLSDSKLGEYVENLTAKLTNDGNLAGVLLTGTSAEGLQLLQRYLDITGDIQSVCMVAMRAFPGHLVQEPLVQDWLEAYRTLLDGWKLWTQRAMFDVEYGNYQAAKQPKQQVFVSCNFCGKSISVYMQGLCRSRGAFARLGSTSNKLKMSACPNCRKPLPRCAICLVHMGTPSGYRTNNRGATNDKLAEFSSWFTWCQTCRHGGHVHHMTHWFKEHQECPVTACTCRCMTLDAAASLRT